MCEICSKLTKKTPKQRQEYRFGVFIVTFIIFIVTDFTYCSFASIVDFEHVNTGWKETFN